MTIRINIVCEIKYWGFIKPRDKPIDKPNVILEEIKSFYEKLYTKEETVDHYDDIFLTNTVKLTENEIEMCESDIDIKECEKCLRKWKMEKHLVLTVLLWNFTGFSGM